MKKGHSSYEELSSTSDGVELQLVKCADNRCVNLLSTFSSASPIGTCKRYDRSKKEIVEIPCPSIVLNYNSFIGDVDLMDALVALYRISLRSKKILSKANIPLVRCVSS